MTYPTKSVLRKSPAANGFDLSIYWIEALQRGAEGGGSVGAAGREQFCYSYASSYKLPDNQGYLTFYVRFGSQFDLSVLDAVHAELATSGIRMNEELSTEWPQKSADLKVKLSEVIRKATSEATWRQDGKTLICEYNIMEFDIHDIDDNGVVDRKSHRETGPQIDGFIIRITPEERTMSQQPRGMYGRVGGPYWRHYFATYQDDYEPIRLDILYGVKVDKKLLEEVTETVGQVYRKPEKF